MLAKKIVHLVNIDVELFLLSEAKTKLTVVLRSNVLQDKNVWSDLFLILAIQRGQPQETAGRVILLASSLVRLFEKQIQSVHI